MNKTILHTEASLGFGGQEIRIVKEAIGMRKKGFNIVLAASPGAKILKVMGDEGFRVYEVPFEKKYFFKTYLYLKKILNDQKIDLINTHSSSDAWLAGSFGKIFKIPVIRTRHLSAPIKKGLNSYILYNVLADFTITTCNEIVPLIINQAKLKSNRCVCIATGIDESQMQVDEESINQFKSRFGIRSSDFVLGTLCVLRSWKGISDILKTAHLMKETPNLKWLIVGSGPSEERFKKEAEELDVLDNVIFTGHQTPPFAALASMDVFLLLSTANEGISQATLQASYFSKPLVTTRTGGLKDICIDHETGLLVEKNSPYQVKKAIEKMMNKEFRRKLGENAKNNVINSYTLDKTLEYTHLIYNQIW